MKKSYSFFLLTLLLFSTTIFAKLYKGGEYRTKESFLYGRFEASFKSSGKEGTLSTMFTYFDGLPNDEWATTKWNEIDIEILNRYVNDVQLNTITPSQTSHVRHQYVNFNPSVNFHTYAIEWTPDYVAWFIDGIEVYKQTDSFVKTLTHPQKYMFNVWIPEGSNWVGIFSPDLLPAFTVYDWASYSAYTPGKGDYGSGNNFTKAWKDEFSNYDTTRWEKATHTFGGNLVDFIPENIVFKDGMMYLCITNSASLGYTDTNSPLINSARAVDESTVRVKFTEKLDKQTAESSSRYLISGSTVKSAALLNDMQTVELKVENLNFEAPPNVIILAGLKDAFSPPNVSGLMSRLILPNKKIVFPLKINLGGGESSGFVADKEFKSDTSFYGHMEGRKVVNANVPIANTELDDVFQSEVNGLAKYVVTLPNGKYKVTLLFAENTLTSEGKRIFDVYVQGKKVVEALDIYKSVGGNTALEKVIDNVLVENNVLDFHFAALLNYAVINGLVIEKVETGINPQSNINNNFRLEQNFPNPFNPATTIEYLIPASTNFSKGGVLVSLKLYDVLGREIETLVNEVKQPGAYSAKLDINNYKLSSGVYYYTLRTEGFAQTRKLVVLK